MEGEIILNGGGGIHKMKPSATTKRVARHSGGGARRSGGRARRRKTYYFTLKPKEYEQHVILHGGLECLLHRARNKCVVNVRGHQYGAPKPKRCKLGQPSSNNAHNNNDNNNIIINDEEQDVVVSCLPDELARASQSSMMMEPHANGGGATTRVMKESEESDPGAAASILIGNMIPIHDDDIKDEHNMSMLADHIEEMLLADLDSWGSPNSVLEHIESLHTHNCHQTTQFQDLIMRYCQMVTQNLCMQMIH